MTNRIAEFDSSADAMAFARAKGDGYTVCGGIDRQYAVREKEHHELCDDIFCERCEDVRNARECTETHGNARANVCIAGVLAILVVATCLGN